MRGISEAISREPGKHLLGRVKKWLVPELVSHRHGDKGKLKSRIPETNNFHVSQESGEASSFLHGAGDTEERAGPLSPWRTYIMVSLKGVVQNRQMWVFSQKEVCTMPRLPPGEGAQGVTSLWEV